MGTIITIIITTTILASRIALAILLGETTAIVVLVHRPKQQLLQTRIERGTVITITITKTATATITRLNINLPFLPQ